MRKYKVHVDLTLIGPAAVDGVGYSIEEAKDSVKDFLEEAFGYSSLEGTASKYNITAEEIEE